MGVSKQNLSPNRLEAFSDGVIAAIITIMMLELIGTVAVIWLLPPKAEATDESRG